MANRMIVHKPTPMVNGHYIAMLLRDKRREWMEQKNADPIHAKDAALALAVFDDLIDILPDDIQAIARGETLEVVYVYQGTTCIQVNR